MTDNKSSIKAVIFDMGGVLLRTVDPIPRSRLAEKYDLTRQQLEALVFSSPNAIDSEKGLVSEEEHWRFVAATLGFDALALPAFIEQYWAGDRLDEELMRYIHELRRTVKTGLLSNAWTGARDSVSKRFGFLEAFDEVLFSAEAGLRKPDRAIFELMLSRLGVEAGEALFVDDFWMNIEGARAVGMQAVHFTDARQAMTEINSLL